MTGLKISGCQRARLHTHLCNEVRQVIQKQDTIMHEALSVEQRIRSSYFVANNWQPRQTIKLSDIISDSSMPHCNSSRVHYSRGATAKIHKVPTGNSLKEVIHSLSTNKDFWCNGQDVYSHYMSPHDFPADYFNRRGWHSLSSKE